MIAPLKPGARLLKVDGPVIETERLILRPWRSATSPRIRRCCPIPVPRASSRPTASPSPRDRRLAQRRSDLGALGTPWLWHVRRRGKIEPAAISVASGHGAHRAGRVLKSAGASTAHFAARVTPWKRRGHRSTGRSRPLRSTRSSIASRPATNRQRASHGGWEPGRMAKSICPARPMSVGDLAGHMERLIHGRGGGGASLCKSNADRFIREYGAHRGTSSLRNHHPGEGNTVDAALVATAAPTAWPSRRDRISPATGSHRRADRRGRSAPGGRA